MNRQDFDLGFLLRYENVAWYESGTVRILDRRVYPSEIRFVTCERHEDVARAIADMVTQSAGPYTAASMGMALAAYEAQNLTEDKQILYLEQAAYTLSHARPTTVNRMKLIVESCLAIAKDALLKGVSVPEAIFDHTIESMNRRYSKISNVASYLVDMFPENGTVMTQCYGETIVGTMLREAKSRGKQIKLICPETRPYLQGARLTASLARDQGVDVTVITDNVPAIAMQTKNVDLFTSAADSICLDGSIVNKCGTLQIAILARHFGIPYFATGIPDQELKTVEQVTIEERDPEETLGFRGVKHTLQGVKGYYPSFDITPPHLVSGVVTDIGILSPFDLQRYYEKDTGKYW